MSTPATSLLVTLCVLLLSAHTPSTVNTRTGESWGTLPQPVTERQDASAILKREFESTGLNFSLLVSHAVTDIPLSHESCQRFGISHRPVFEGRSELLVNDSGLFVVSQESLPGFVLANAEGLRIEEQTVMGDGWSLGQLHNDAESVLAHFFLKRAIESSPWQLTHLPTGCQKLTATCPESVLEELKETSTRSHERESQKTIKSISLAAEFYRNGRFKDLRVDIVRLCWKRRLLRQRLMEHRTQAFVDSTQRNGISQVAPFDLESTTYILTPRSVSSDRMRSCSARMLRMAREKVAPQPVEVK